MALGAANANIPESAAQKALSSLDKNADGKLDKDEFFKLVEMIVCACQFLLILFETSL